MLDQTTCPAHPPHAYTYKLTATAGSTYTYDGDGKRVQKSNGTIYWYGMAGDVLDETDLTGSTTNAAFKEYVFFDGKRIAVLATAYPPVQNPSFETPNTLNSPCGTGCAYNSGPIPSWSGGGSFRPNSTYFNLPLPNGSIIACTNGGTLRHSVLSREVPQ